MQFGGSVPGMSDDHTGLTNCTPLIPGTRCTLMLKFIPNWQCTPTGRL